jgi:uncharacterized protein (DUF4415 family)
MKKGLTKKQLAELEALEAMPEEDINFSDIPEITDWAGFEVGEFYRPVKKSVNMRIDADVIDWLKHKGKGYTTRINDMLRSEMQKERKKEAA